MFNLCISKSQIVDGKALIKFYLDSERVSPTGNISSQGILNQLGRPNLNNAAVLVREAVQNSWDARLSDRRMVYFEISGWTLNSQQRRFLADIVFSDTPPLKTLGLNKLLKSKEPISLLAIYDQGTTGLGGPTRADELTNENESRDFVDFLRNVGQPPNKKLAGGTYGYGKAAYYRASKVNTICVYTRCRYKGKSESRFIVSGLGLPFESNRTRFTGRHWWGRKKSGIAEPILGSEADLIAEKLGIRLFKKNESGSAIVILQPNFPSNSLEDPSSSYPMEKALNKMAEYLVWYFWPKMLKHKANTPMSFKITHNDRQIPIPNPSQYSPIKPFVEAMSRLRNEKTTMGEVFKHNVLEISSQKPYQVLGNLALQIFPTEVASDVNQQDNGFVGITHHVALMRQPELIVKYYEGPVLGTSSLGYAGVFISDQAVDAIFAEAEPPTHDDWIPNSLEERTHKIFVRVALRHIFREMENFSKPFAVQVHDNELLPLGGFSTRLANSIFPTVIGWSANTDASTNLDINKYKTKEGSSVSNANESSTMNTGDYPQSWNIKSSDIINPPIYVQAEKGKSESASKKESLLGRSRVKVLSDDNFILLNGKRALQIDFAIKHGENSSGTNIKVIPHALIDDGHSEVEPPIGGSNPRVLLWIDANDKKYTGAEEIFISKSSEDVWRVIIYVPEDIMVGIDFKAEARI